jgi:hypothetical protein
MKVGSELVNDQRAMTWASKPLATPAEKVISAVRTGITIESITTHRSMLVVREKSQWPDFIDEAELADFDQVPVTEGHQIVGIYDRGKGTLRDLSESMFMAADASLLGYLEIADSRQFAFIVSENQIVGIVTLSDIQKLPVYCVLFSLLMSVEMLLVECIRAASNDDPNRWMDHLGPKTKVTIEEHWIQAQKENIGIDRLSCASFGNELSAAQGLGLLAPDEIATLKRLKKLRNDVFHGKEIGLIPDRALEIPVHVRDAIKTQAMLQEKLKGLPA